LCLTFSFQVVTSADKARLDRLRAYWWIARIVSAAVAMASKVQQHQVRPSTFLFFVLFVCFFIRFFDNHYLPKGAATPDKCKHGRCCVNHYLPLLLFI
jgi:hypothetical protein